MTKQTSDNSGASCSVDALVLALQKLELSILQSNDALNNRVKLLETKFDGFQSFLADTEKTRTQNTGLVLNAVMTMTNNATQLLLQSYQQRAVLESQLVAQRNAPGDIEQLLQANTLRTLQSMMPPQVPAPPQQPPVLPTPQQTPLFSQPPSAVPPPTVFSTPVQPSVPAMQPPRIPQPLFSFVTATPPVIPPSTVVAPPVSKPAPVLPASTTGFGDKFTKKDGEWDCSECYLRNKADATKCAACTAPKDGKQAETAKDIKTGPSAAGASIFGEGFKSGSLFGTSSKQSGPALSFAFVPNQEVTPEPDADRRTAALPVEANVEETGGDTEAVNNESPEAFVPDQHYEPVIPLPPKIEVQTGEEDEQKLFESHGKLYINTPEGIKERGIGSIKILRNTKNNKLRVVVRRDQVLKICLNAPIVQGMTVKDKPGKETVGIFNCKDFSGVEQPEGKDGVFLVKFATVAEYQQFKRIMNEAAGMRAAATPVKDEQKPSAPGPAAATNILKPSTFVVESKEVPMATTPFSFNFTPKTTSTPNTAGSPFASKPFSPSTGAPTFSSFLNTGSLSPFGSQSNTSNSSIFVGGLKSGSLFGSTGSQSPGLTFGDISKQGSFLDKSKFDTNNSFGARSIQLIAEETGGDTEVGNDESPEAFVPDQHYEPVIPLPPKIEVQTGEEGETKLFEAHGKLYINTPEGIKERGIGYIKILSKNGKCRVVVRRDQVLKICLNAPIVQGGMNVKDKPGKDTVGIFNCKDFSDGPDGKDGVFLVKFGNVAEYQQFKRIWNEQTGTSSGSATPVKDESKAPESTSAETSSVKARGKIGNEPVNLPSIEPDEAEDEEDDDDYEDEEAENYEDEQHDVDYRVIYECPCNVTFNAAYVSPMQKSLAKGEIMKDVQLIISTADDDSFRVAFEKTEDEEHFPHFLDKTYDFKIQGNNIQYVARHVLTGERKSVTCEFKDPASLKKTLDELEHCKSMTSYENSEYED